jgi:hypothetical protein
MGVANAGVTMATLGLASGAVDGVSNKLFGSNLYSVRFDMGDGVENIKLLRNGNDGVRYTILDCPIPGPAFSANVHNNITEENRSEKAQEEEEEVVCSAALHVAFSMLCLLHALPASCFACPMLCLLHALPAPRLCAFLSPPQQALPRVFACPKLARKLHATNSHEHDEY